MAWAVAANVVGQLASSALDFYGQQKANNKNISLARQQMDFQERMSSSAYQRAMQDMREAGLNPILAYKQGPASSPTGATATVQNALAGAANKISQTASSALAVQQQTQQNARTRAELEKFEKYGSGSSADAADTAAKIAGTMYRAGERGSSAVHNKRLKDLSIDGITKWLKKSKAYKGAQDNKQYLGGRKAEREWYEKNIGSKIRKRRRQQNRKFGPLTQRDKDIRKVY